jgi:hypothetical protein
LFAEEEVSYQEQGWAGAKDWLQFEYSSIKVLVFIITL